MGFAGGLVMSAIKRDRGVKDYGSVITGHSGVMDRIDSLCFAAPVFFHFVRWGLNLGSQKEPAPASATLPVGRPG
jgi:phosphatidate cytidylyltransferase